MKPFRRSSILQVRSLEKLTSRTSRRRLAFESLEHRTLLAATSSGLGVGVNLSQTNYYNDEYMWANAMEQANDSWWLGQESAGGSSYAFVQNPPPGIAMPAMDSNGYPIGLGGLAAQGYSLATFVFTNIGVPFPTGTYTLTFDGRGTVAICQANQPVQSFTQTSSVGSPFDVNILPTGSGITVAITSSDRSHYVRNIRLVLPGLQQSYQSDPFNPQFLNALQPFSTIRFIGAMLPDFSSATASDGQSGPLTWAERTPPTYFTQATPAGMSVEYMVQLCNILHENMWVTMPVNGTSDYVTNFAQYVEQNLNPGLKVYVELGDELWNGAFQYEYNYVQSYANANNESHAYATADLTAACWSNWEQVFAGQTNRMVRVAATQFSNPYILGQELTRLIATASPTDPNHGFDVVSGGSYFSAITNSYNASTTVGQIESDMMAQLTGPWKQTLQYFMSTVASFEAQLGRPIPVDMYEGGEGLTYTGGSSWYNAYVALDSDPGNYAVITTFLDDLTNAGVQGVVYTSLASQATQYGEWGAMEYVGQPSSQTPKYNALVNFTSLGMSIPSVPVTAGIPFQLTVTAYEPNGSTVDTNYTGTVKFASSDLQAVLPTIYTFTPADKGVHTVTVTLYTAGPQSISTTSSTDGAVGLLQGVVVQAATAHSLVITGLSSSVYSGLSDSFKVTAYDAYGNVATGYTGTVTFTSSDPLAGLPSNYTFTPAAAGVQAFAVQLQSDGTKTITVTDTTTPTLTSSASATVVPHIAATWDVSTQGNWVGTYGSQGYDLFSGPNSLPSYAIVTETGGTPFTWASNTTDPRALQEPGGTGRIAPSVYSPTSLTVDVNLTDGNTHSLALYFLDWDNNGRSEQVQLANAATGAILDTQTMSAFYGGVYLDWNISGNVLITITRLAGANAVLSGLFVGPSSASASLIRTDTTTQGHWIGTYGAQGYDLFNVGSSLASYATVTNTGASLLTWATGTTDPRAPQQPGGTSRIAAAEFGQSFTVDVNLTDGEKHVLALYFLDWDNLGRAEQVQLTNATTGAVLDTETVSSFAQGVYLDWNISGNVLITITRLAGPNAVLSGLFLSPPSASASLVGTDTTTQGNWIGTYGKSGYDLFDVGSSLPSYASVVDQGGALYAWTTNTTDPRALELPSGTGRAAAIAYAPTSFTIDLNLTDGNTHLLALYFLDWDNQGRSEQVQITNAATGAVHDTETVSSFYGGVYLKWNVSGNVLITITRLSGPNAVLSGLFIN
jgi:hypothetical protein